MEQVPGGYRPKCLVISRWGNFLVVFRIIRMGSRPEGWSGWASISDLLFLGAKQGSPCPPRRGWVSKVRGRGERRGPLFPAVSLGALPFQMSGRINLQAPLLLLGMGLCRLAPLSALLSLSLSLYLSLYIYFFLFQPFTFSTMHKNNFADWGRSQAIVSQPGALAGSASVQTPTALTPLPARGLLQPAGAEARTSAGANRQSGADSGALRRTGCGSRSSSRQDSVSPCVQ